MRSIPLHLQVLMHLRDALRERKRVLEERCGKGLTDQDYQRAVGGIKELSVSLEAVGETMKSGLEEIEDHEESVRDNKQQAARGSARRNRTTQ